MEEISENQTFCNKVTLHGTIDSSVTYSHEMHGEKFYDFFIFVPRLSDKGDRLPVTVSEKLIEGKELNKGQPISIFGQFRSYNRLENEKSKLMLTIFVREFIEQEEVENPNFAQMIGYVCKPPIFRVTPFNREICDVLLAVNRSYSKSDYIPCIAWGRNARLARSIEVGQKIEINGRIQSREYNKKLSEDVTEVRTAYELSIGRIIEE